MRRFRRCAADSLVVRVLEGGVQLAVPAWMLDPDFCQKLVDEPLPRVHVDALTELRQLLDSQPLLASAKESEQQKGRIPKRRR